MMVMIWSRGEQLGKQRNKISSRIVVVLASPLAALGSWVLDWVAAQTAEAEPPGGM